MVERRDEQHGMKNVREKIKWYRVNTYENICSNWERERERERGREIDRCFFTWGQQILKPITKNTHGIKFEKMIPYNIFLGINFNHISIHRVS